MTSCARRYGSRGTINGSILATLGFIYPAAERRSGNQSQTDGEDIPGRGAILEREKRRKTAAMARVGMPTPTSPNERWSMDFVNNRTVTGRRFCALMIVDDYSRRCPAIEVDTSLGGHRVVSILEKLAEIRGLPEVITVDNGPEFAGKVLDEWAYRREVKLNFIRPGKPVENAYAESFIGRFRDECLNENWFISLKHARLYWSCQDLC